MTQTATRSNTPDPTRQIIHGTYYPHIDGIRAMAVLPVVLYHILAGLCPGGFGGVDVFFVISGYLITGGVLRDLDRGQFSLGSFYHRRIRRILPAYIVLIAGVFAIGCAVYYALPLTNLGDSAIAGTLFSANIFFHQFYGNYFAADLHNNPLIHLWSLSVEEQFYLVIPLLCAIVWRWNRRLVPPVLVLLAAGSLIASIHAVATGGQQGAFYLLHFRAWELLAGALLALPPALEPQTDAPASVHRLRAALPVLGLLMVCVAYAVVRAGTPFPGATALPFIVGTALLIRYGQDGWMHKLLSWPPAVALGRISYSLYLWHWPIIVFWRYMTYDQLTPWDYAGMFVLSLLMSWLSWKFVEMPVRLARTWTPRHSFTLAAAGIALLLAIGMSCVASRGWAARLHVRANAMSAIQDHTSRVMRTLFVVQRRVAALSGTQMPDNYWQLMGGNGDYQLGVPGRPATLILLGDSHAGVLQYGLDGVLRDTGHSGFAIIRDSTPLFISSGTDSRHALEELANRPEVTRVLLAQKWDGYLTPGAEAAACDALADFARRVRAMHKTLYLAAQVPSRDFDPSDLAARVRIMPPRHPNPAWYDGRQPAADYEQRLGAINQCIRAVCQNTGAVFVPMHQAFREGDAFIAFVMASYSPVPLYKDPNHLTKAGSVRAANYLRPYLVPSR